ncbi:MAG: FG-GAP repeat protein [Bacteroidota bacterium]
MAICLLWAPRAATAQFTLSKLVLDESTYPDADYGSVIASDGDRILVSDESLYVIYVFDFDGSTWVESGVLEMPPEDNIYNTYGGPVFGSAVALDGDRVVIGNYHDHTRMDGAGSVYVFELRDGEWQQTAKLFASDLGTRQKP